LQRFRHNIVTSVHELSQLVGQRRLHHRHHRRWNSELKLTSSTICGAFICSYRNHDMKVNSEIWVCIDSSLLMFKYIIIYSSLFMCQVS
jgi:hypothetical protein